MNNKFRPSDLIMYPMLFLCFIYGLVAYTAITIIFCAVAAVFLLISEVLHGGLNFLGRVRLWKRKE